MSPMADNLPANFGVFCDFTLSTYRQIRFKLTISVMWVIIFHMCTKFEVRRPFLLEDMADFVSRPGDLDL